MTPELEVFFRLAPLGLLVGAYGTLVGAGGGSVLVPVLLMLLPEKSPASITSISIAVVFFNAYSGTIAYVRMGRIDYRAGVLFTLAGIPGAVLGTLLVHEMPRSLFDPIFGVLLLVIGGLLVANPLGTRGEAVEESPAASEGRMLSGSIGSAYIGVLSSLLGIGGGIIHVPFLVRGLRMPPHVATATSHFVLTFVALTATITHIVLREFDDDAVGYTMYLAVGVMMGAPVGAALSSRLQGSLIVRLLALALCLVGARLLGRMLVA